MGHSLWPFWTSAWSNSYLLEENALFSGLSFLSLHFQPSCFTITPSNILQGILPFLFPFWNSDSYDADELDAIFNDDVLKHWDEMEQDDSKVEGGNGGRGRAGGRRRVGAGLGRRGKGGGSGRHGGRPRPGLPPPGSAAAGASQVETPRRRSSGSSAPLGSGFKVGPFTRCFPRSSGGDGGGRVSGGGRAGGRPAEGAEREGAINEG
ncbi:hypothetical protein SETIT_J003400v2 [Setaria italica]|uniref:Uncharacterized protein n=1 Tax=Setaria italica TaxID=4555 RepID=A0A368PGA7_SETIT|nr:hypothetical protein SETIT_J003400v2 [Setaria italica]